MPPLWIFGYGSLVWRPSFAFAERRPAAISDWARRFWQGSTDHRGIPGAPGRVVTLVSAPGARCGGMAYRIAERDADAVLRALDHREKGGYERREVALTFQDGSVAGGVMYIATPANTEYLGPATLEEMARQIRAAVGPSGTNREYVLRLAEALAGLDAADPHVEALASLLGDDLDTDK